MCRHCHVLQMQPPQPTHRNSITPPSQAVPHISLYRCQAHVRSEGSYIFVWTPHGRAGGLQQ
jgi:hypothetical protein